MMSGMALGPTQPPIQWISGVLSLGVKQPGHKADHSPPSSAQVKNVWSYTSTPQYVLMAWSFVKHRDFTLPYLTFAFAFAFAFSWKVMTVVTFFTLVISLSWEI
jgi:hypothetical protein